MSILLKTKNFSLEKVNNSKPHIDLLFKLLKQRKIANNISHSKIFMQNIRNLFTILQILVYY